MSRHLVLRTFGFVLVTALASCATSGAGKEPAPPAATTEAAASTHEWEPWPPADVAKRAAQPADSGETVTLLPKDGGWRIDELFDQVHKTTGVSFLYDSGNATFKQAKVEFVGAHVVRQKDLFAWLQAVLAYRKLVIVPVGPKTADGKQQWLVMDQADPNLKSRPVFVDESDVFDYAERDGLYVVTLLRVRDTVDLNRVRNALSPLSTQTAGIGRIQDTGGRHLIVGDFAPVVASMKRMLDRINAETPPSAVRPPVAPPPTPKPEK
jgi:hypothetical protein